MLARTPGKSILISLAAVLLLAAAPAGAALLGPDDEQEAPLRQVLTQEQAQKLRAEDRKSTRLNSSHIQKSRMPSSA